MTLLQEYMNIALKRAKYELMEDGIWCATVKGLRGVIAIGETVELCREDLESATEDWVLFRIANGMRVPSEEWERP